MIKGLHTVLITPFTANDEVDIEGLRSLINYQIDAGVDGLVFLGTTGETPTLDEEEQELIIKTGITAVQGRVPVMVGCGSYSTKKTIEQAQHAEELGASSLLVVVPYYNKPTQEGMYLHFKAIAEATSLPICIYNVASRTGVNLETPTLERLAELPSIVSVKEASGNIQQMMDVIERVALKKKGFSVVSGDDILTLPLMILGGHGVLSVISNLIPHTMKEFMKAAESADFETARALHYAMKPLIQAAFIETNPIPIKRMVELVGLPAGKCRLPLSSLQPQNDQKLQETLNLCQHLWNAVPSFLKLQAATSSKKSGCAKLNSSEKILMPS